MFDTFKRSYAVSADILQEFVEKDFNRIMQKVADEAKKEAIKKIDEEIKNYCDQMKIKCSVSKDGTELSITVKI